MAGKPEISSAAVVVLVALAAMGAVAVGLRSGSAVVVVDDTRPVEIPADGSGVVADLRAPGGLALFGVQLVDPTHEIEVRFLAGPGCSELLDTGDHWPVPYPECAGDAGITGVVGTLGVTATGRSVVGVKVTVPGECFDLLERGAAWPSDAPGCASAG